jgi:hypothetical protein
MLNTAGASNNRAVRSADSMRGVAGTITRLACDEIASHTLDMKWRESNGVWRLVLPVRAQLFVG